MSARRGHSAWPSVLTRRALLAGAAALGLHACVGPSEDEAATPPTAGPGTTAASSSSSSAVASTTGPAAATASPAAAPTTAVAVGPARFVQAGDRSAPFVALTFHGAGDPVLFDRLLTIVNGAKAPITVFAVGQWLADQPAVASRLAAGGHELANHTWSHPAMGTVARATVASEIARCRDVLIAQTGTGGRWFRPSGIEIPTDDILAEAGAAGYATCVGYDVDSLDFTDPGASAVVANVAAAVGNGSIISLHTGHEDTVRALPPLLALLDARGLQPVTVSALLG